MRRHSARKFQVYDPAPSEQPSGRLGQDAPADHLDVLRGSKIPRWKRHYVTAKQPGVLQFTRQRRKKTQEFTLNLEGAKVAEHLEHPRQFSVITPTRTCYLRVKDREKRGSWVKAIQESIDSLTNAVDKLRTSLRPSGGTPQSSLHSISRKLTQELARAADDPGMERRAHARAARRWQDIQAQTPSIEQQLGGLSNAGPLMSPTIPGPGLDAGIQQQPARSRLSQTSGINYNAQPAFQGSGMQGPMAGSSGLQEHNLAVHNLQMPPEGGPFLQEGMMQSGAGPWLRPSSPSRLQNLRGEKYD